MAEPVDDEPVQIQNLKTNQLMQETRYQQMSLTKRKLTTQNLQDVVANDKKSRKIVQLNEERRHLDHLQ